MIVSLDFFKKNRKKLKKVVLVGGAFDVIHPGHITHLKEAKSLGNTLVVHITGDKRVKEKKGPGRPVFGEKQRAQVVSAIRSVDYVFTYDGRHFDQKVIDAIKPDVIFFNDESYSGREKEIIDNLKNFHGKIMVSRAKKEDSSTRAIGLLKK